MQEDRFVKLRVELRVSPRDWQHFAHMAHGALEGNPMSGARPLLLEPSWARAPDCFA